MSYCYYWWSKKHNNSIQGRNVLGITIKIGKLIIPHNSRIVSKQGRGNTDKPSLLAAMLEEVLDFFNAEGIDLRKYPITFDSWYGGQKLVQSLSYIEFDRILILGKIRTMMVFGNPLRSSEILKIWSQHQGIEEFWRNTRVVFRMT